MDRVDENADRSDEPDGAGHERSVRKMRVEDVGAGRGDPATEPVPAARVCKAATHLETEE